MAPPRKARARKGRDKLPYESDTIYGERSFKSITRARESEMKFKRPSGSGYDRDINAEHGTAHGFTNQDNIWSSDVPTDQLTSREEDEEDHISQVSMAIKLFEATPMKS